MVNSLRSCGSAFALVVLSAVAAAQPVPADLQCRSTETQAECHARLKCKADEEIQTCQKRLAATRGGNDRGNDRGGDDRGDDRGRNDRGGDDRGNDRGGDDRGNDRGRDDRGSDRGGDRGGDDGARSQRRGRGDRGGRGGRGRRGGDRDFEANKIFGLGLELGEPTGLTGKYFVSESGAIDFGVGWIYRHYYYGDGLHLYGDYLWHPLSLTSADAFELPFYVGIGLRYWRFDYCDNRVCEFEGSAIGVRVPLGIAFDFNNAPLDIFIQVVPVLDFVDGDYYDRYDDRTHLGVDLSLGIRYWFK